MSAKPKAMLVKKSDLASRHQREGGQSHFAPRTPQNWDSPRRNQCAIDRPQQPGPMGHHGHGVGMNKVQQVEAGKREDQSPQQRRVAAGKPAPQQQIAPPQHQRIADEQFQVEGHAERQKAIEHQMQRMIRAGLAFARSDKIR